MHEKSLQILKKGSALLGFQLHAFKKLPNSAFEINCVWKNSFWRQTIDLLLHLPHISRHFTYKLYNKWFLYKTEHIK